MTHLCVVGPSGYVGSRLVSAGRARGHRVATISSRDPDGIDPSSGLFRGAPPIPSDVDSLIYLAHPPRSGEGRGLAERDLAVSSVSALACGSACLEKGVRRFVYLSTGSVYQPALAPLPETALRNRGDAYPLCKLAGEEALAVLEPGIELIRVRLFTVYGPGQSNRLVPRLASSVVSGRDVELQAAPDGSEDGGLRISLIHVDDVVEALLAWATAREERRGVVNLASPDALSIRAIAEALGSALGRAPFFRPGPKRRGDLVADTTLLGRWLPGHRFRVFAREIPRLASSLVDLEPVIAPPIEESRPGSRLA